MQLYISICRHTCHCEVPERFREFQIAQLDTFWISREKFQRQNACAAIQVGSEWVYRQVSSKRARGSTAFNPVARLVNCDFCLLIFAIWRVVSYPKRSTVKADRRSSVLTYYCCPECHNFVYQLLMKQLDVDGS